MPGKDIMVSVRPAIGSLSKTVDQHGGTYPSRPPGILDSASGIERMRGPAGSVMSLSELVEHISGPAGVHLLRALRDALSDAQADAFRETPDEDAPATGTRAANGALWAATSELTPDRQLDFRAAPGARLIAELLEVGRAAARSVLDRTESIKIPREVAWHDGPRPAGGTSGGGEELASCDANSVRCKYQMHVY